MNQLDRTDWRQENRELHGEYTLRHYVVQKDAATPYGCYVQAAREIVGRERTLEELDLHLEEIAWAIKRLKLVAWLSKKAAFALRRKELELRRVREHQAEVQRELRCLKRVADEHRRTMGTPLATLSESARERLDAREWTARTKIRGIYELVARTTGMTVETLRMLAALPEAQRHGLADSMRDGAMKWLNSRSENGARLDAGCRSADADAKLRAGNGLAHHSR